jgi:hypothetical protein
MGINPSTGIPEYMSIEAANSFEGLDQILGEVSNAQLQEPTTEGATQEPGGDPDQGPPIRVPGEHPVGGPGVTGGGLPGNVSGPDTGGGRPIHDQPDNQGQPGNISVTGGQGQPESGGVGGHPVRPGQRGANGQMEGTPEGQGATGEPVGLVLQLYKR